MGVDSTDAYGKPVFNDAFALPGDLSAAVDFTDTFANVRRGTAAERQGLEPGKRRAGMLFSETDTGMVYVDRGDGSWRVVSGDTGWTALPLSNGWVNFGGAYSTARYRRTGTIVHVTGVVKNGATAGATVIGTLPAGFRPDGNIVVATSSAAGVATLDVLTTGEIRVGTNASATFTSIELDFVAAGM